MSINTKERRSGQNANWLNTWNSSRKWWRCFTRSFKMLQDIAWHFRLKPPWSRFGSMWDSIEISLAFLDAVLWIRFGLTPAWMDIKYPLDWIEIDTGLDRYQMPMQRIRLDWLGFNTNFSSSYQQLIGCNDGRLWHDPHVNLLPNPPVHSMIKPSIKSN